MAPPCINEVKRKGEGEEKRGKEGRMCGGR